MKRFARTAAARLPLAVASLALVSFGLAGCSNSAQTLLSTGSIMNTSKPEAAAPKPVTPVDRALQVAAVSARAQKCGYFFDPAKLKSAYLAHEAANGLPPDQVPGLTKTFDFAKSQVATKLAGDPNYCSTERLASIKQNLTRHLAGDFTPPVTTTKAKSGGGLFEVDQPEGKEKLNPEFLRDKNAPPTIRVE